MSKICPCPHPPGGHIICEDHQFGMCAYRDGKKVGGCLNVPGAIRAIKAQDERNVATTNWVLIQITGERRDYYAPITPDETEMLRSGEFTNVRGEVTRFTLPEDLDLDNMQSVGLATA